MCSHSTTSRDLNLKIQGKEGNLQLLQELKFQREKFNSTSRVSGNIDCTAMRDLC